MLKLTEPLSYLDEPVKQKSEYEEYKLSPKLKLRDLVKQKMQERNLDVKGVANLLVCGENHRNNVINRLTEFLNTGVMRESTLMELYQVLEISQEELKTIKEYAEKKEAFEKNLVKINAAQDECFMNNFKLLLKYADLIIKTPEYSNITVPMVSCGLMYTDRHRPLTLGELFFFYKRNRFVYERPENPCCKIKYGIRIGGSLLSGRTWVTAFCPECHGITRLETTGVQSLLVYIKTPPFPYEISEWDVVKFVDYLGEVERRREKDDKSPDN